MSRTKKYFWLKLRRDFFKRHDTKIIESMENGKDYLLFYLKLLVESIDHEGSLRFSDTIPYNDKMLATITDTNIDIVRSAVKVFSELGMIEQFDDGTLFMSHVNTMIGFETSDALRMKEIRETKKQVIIEQETSEQRSQMFAERSPSVPECSKTFENRSPELEIRDRDRDKDREIQESTTEQFSDDESFADDPPPSPQPRFRRPTLEEVAAYCVERRNGINAQRFIDYQESRGWKIGKAPMKDWKAAVRTWEQNDRERAASSLKVSQRTAFLDLPEAE